MFFKSICLAVTLTATALPSMAVSGIWRGCSAEITFNTSSMSAVLARVEGRGPCRNKLNADDCRLHARSAIVNCASALWRDRWQHTLPHECRTNSSGRAKTELVFSGIHATLPSNESIKGRIEYASCCTGSARNSRVVGNLMLRVRGDKQCGFSATLQSGYVSHCEQVVAAGYCG